MVLKRSRLSIRRSRKEMNIFKRVTKLLFHRVWKSIHKIKLLKHLMRTCPESTWNILIRNLSLERKICLYQMIIRNSDLAASSWQMAWKMWLNKIKISFKKFLICLTREKNWSNKIKFLRIKMRKSRMITWKFLIKTTIWSKIMINWRSKTMDS